MVRNSLGGILLLDSRRSITGYNNANVRFTGLKRGAVKFGKIIGFIDKH